MYHHTDKHSSCSAFWEKLTCNQIHFTLRSCTWTQDREMFTLFKKKTKKTEKGHCICRYNVARYLRILKYSKWYCKSNCKKGKVLSIWGLCCVSRYHSLYLSHVYKTVPNSMQMGEIYLGTNAEAQTWFSKQMVFTHWTTFYSKFSNLRKLSPKNQREIPKVEGFLTSNLFFVNKKVSSLW